MPADARWQLSSMRQAVAQSGTALEFKASLLKQPRSCHKLATDMWNLAVGFGAFHAQEEWQYLEPSCPLMQDEDEWEEELPPSDYHDEGVLTTSLSSFADLRSIARGPRAERSRCSCRQPTPARKHSTSAETHQLSSRKQPGRPAGLPCQR